VVFTMVFRITAALFVLLSLSGCQTVTTSALEYSPPALDRGQECVIQCQNVREQCNKSCSESTKQCLQQKQTEALDNLTRYKKRMQTAPQLPERDFNSFYNTLQCDTPKCRCEVNYRACYQLCGGQVTERSVCLEHCD